jgi:hypothetical protein
VWLERHINIVFRVWEKFAFLWDSLKVSDLRKVKVKNHRLILVLYRQSHVTALIARALTKVKELLADLNVGIHGAGHHLHLQVLVLNALTIIAEGHYSERGVILWLNYIFGCL